MPDGFNDGLVLWRLFKGAPPIGPILSIVGLSDTVAIGWSRSIDPDRYRNMGEGYQEGSSWGSDIPKHL